MNFQLNIWFDLSVPFGGCVIFTVATQQNLLLGRVVDRGKGFVKNLLYQEEDGCKI